MSTDVMTTIDTAARREPIQGAITGLHHITAISGDAQRTYDFYAKGLGLRFVKKTVNFDDPSTYHFYFGDRLGAAGTVMTFFPWAGVPAGTVGRGQATLTQFRAPLGALDAWAARLPTVGARVLARETVFGEERLIALDPDGLPFAIVASAEADAGADDVWTAEGIGPEMAIRGFHGVTLALAEERGVGEILMDLFGYARLGEEDAPGGRLVRYAIGAPGDLARIVDLHIAPELGFGREGAGIVHHVAFSTPNRETHAAIRKRIAAAGHKVTPQIDRDYFEAIYFRTPGGVLFEVATDGPGFSRDEPADRLGQALKLPARHEPKREVIERILPPLTL